MSIQLKYPGVYIEEVPSGVRTIAGVSTSIAAFVGYTRKGVPDKAVHITSFADFERSHGGLDRESPVSYAVQQFFLNGGTEAYVVRVATGAARASWELTDTNTPTPVTVLNTEAASPGTWGNGLELTVQHTEARNPDSEINLLVKQFTGQGSERRLVAQEVHRNLNLNSHSANYAVAVVNDASQLIRVERPAGLTFDQAGFAVSQSITFPLTVTDNIMAGTVDATTGFRIELDATPDNMADLVSAINSKLSAAAFDTKLQAIESAEDGSTGTGSLKLVSQAPGESSAVTIAAGAFGGLTRTIGLGLANGGREFTGDAQHRPAVITAQLPTAKGADGSKGGATELQGSPGDKSGIYALRDVDLFNLLSIPETRDLPDSEANAVIAAAVHLCEDERAFYIVDAPSGKKLTDIAIWANGASHSRNAATYFPAISISDPLDGFRLRPMAPSGTLAGVYARTDATRGVWKAPAGTDATLNGVAGISIPINDIENGNINIQGVNALRSFPTYGRVAWGARTMKGADAQSDEYKYIPVRRLALFLEESLYRGTQWVVFEPNDEPLWAQIRLNVGAFMQNLFRQGAFQGSSPRQAYLVKCDRETTTQNDIDLGIVNILVGFAPLKPAEFVVIKIQQMAGQLEV